jgi:hypothetical protein
MLVRPSLPGGKPRENQPWRSSIRPGKPIPRLWGSNNSIVEKIKVVLRRFPIVQLHFRKINMPINPLVGPLKAA